MIKEELRDTLLIIDVIFELEGHFHTDAYALMGETMKHTMIRREVIVIR